VGLSWFLCFTVLLSGCGGGKMSPERVGPVYTAVKIDEPPVIDGILTDPCWKRAETASLVSSRDGAAPLFPTIVRMMWDEDNLYIGFECRDTDAASTVFERDGPVSTEECVSVYMDADADSATYVVIDVAPTGVTADAFVIRRADGAGAKILRDWNCDGARTSVSVYGGGAEPGTEDRFWTVEMMVPLGEFLTARRIPPVPGDFWRVNFSRLELTGERRFSTLAPTGKDSGDVPAKFFWLLFGG